MADRPMLRNHPSSLVPSSEHHPLVEELRSIPSCHPALIDYMLRLVCSLAGRHIGDNPLKTYRFLNAYASYILNQASISTATVLCTIVYLSRATRYHTNTGTVSLAHRRVFIGALICAYKITNDANHRGATWSHISLHFTPKEIMAMELDWCFTLDWSFGISDDDILEHYQPLKRACFPPRHPSPEIRCPVAQHTETPLYHEGRQRVLLSPCHSNSDSEASPISSSLPTSPFPYLSSTHYQSLDVWTPESTLQSSTPRLERKRKRASHIASDDDAQSESSRSRHDDLSNSPSIWESVRNVKRHCPGRAHGASAKRDRTTRHGLIQLLRSYGQPIPNALAAWE
ncbi:hypothetical protein NEOLEDRAFT_233281 [Neolentinus lepideus HHB14362 ss-1]|uniref:Cyclin N-terminal domain-containing protein n=1 Tax=Neolentinus lepideus HHB14362 ss-1 TaxID=1314782 RepID=A0A165TFV2_9AGAM|nr:hypothetical protein NEOLEDRAFT_233281 [Neolentinus lepideus HHB14362 ss-1]